MNKTCRRFTAGFFVACDTDCCLIVTREGRLAGGPIGSWNALDWGLDWDQREL